MTDQDRQDANVAEMIANGTPMTKALRRYAGMTVEQMSAAAGISHMRLVAVESGSEPAFDEVQRISSAPEQPRTWAQSK